MPDAVLLRTERLTRAYGSLLAVSDVDVSVQRGELRSDRKSTRLNSSH